MSAQLHLPLAWYRVSGLREERAPATPPTSSHPEEDGRTVTFDTTVALRTHPRVATPTNAFEVSRQAAAEIRAEAARGTEVLLGVARDGEVNTVVSVRADGSVEFLGVCRRMHSTTPFEDAYQRLRADGFGGSRRDLLFTVIDKPDGPEARAMSTTAGSHVTWYDVPEAVRVLGPDAVPSPPAELMASLTEVHLTVRLPAAWRDFPGGLAVRTRNGWTLGVLFSVATSGDVVLTTYVEGGERPQVWLVTDMDDLTTAVGKAGEAAPGATLTGDASITTYDALRARIAAGEPVLR